MDVFQALQTPRRREILRLLWDEELAAGEGADIFLTDDEEPVDLVVNGEVFDGFLFHRNGFRVARSRRSERSAAG